jgi:cysteine-rich repeat protein
MLRFVIAMVLLGGGLSACGGEEGSGAGLALRDPAALIDEIEGDPRLLILPSDSFTCDSATGFTTPNPPEERTAEIPEAIVDRTFGIGETVMANVPPGTWVILVRGWGTDEVSGRTDFMIATGCATDDVANQGTKEVTIELIQNFGEGVCGDSILSPDEQCDDGNTMPGDGCDASCRTEPFLVSRTAGMEAAAEVLPAAAWSEDARLSVVYDSDLGTRNIRMMMLDQAGGIIETPTALSVDGEVDDIPDQQTVPSVGMGGGRYGVAFASFAAAMDETGVFVRFFDNSRNAADVSTQVSASPMRGETDPSIALMPDGTALVVFVDPASATGLTGRVFAAGSTTPTGMPFPAGTGQTGATAPAVAASTAGFVVTFAAGGNVYYQRYGADGAAIDAMAVSVGSGDTPAVASLSDGRTAIAWATGFSLQAQVYDAAMTEVGSVLDLGAGSEPTLAASRDRFAVAYVEGSGIMARMISPDGAFALNRDAPPSTDAFPVATGSVVAPAAAAGGTASDPLWIVTWQDNGMDPAGDIRGRLFPLP